MNPICEANPCPVILSSSCVFYEGANLIYIGVNTNDTLEAALEKINSVVQNIHSGTSGTSGTSGISGTSGTSGSSGLTGSNGTSGTTGTSGSSGSSGTSGSSGESGDIYKTSSVSTLTICTAGSIVVGVNLAYTVGQTIRIAYDVNNYQEAIVVSYNPLTGVLVFNAPTECVGSGTYSSWIVNISGASGGDGSSGTSGSSGLTGSAGTSGTTGTSGSSGTSGINGSNGTSGTSGTSGIDGTSGLNGSSGTTGTSGSSGIDGTSGTTGTSGVSGSSGTSGVDGGSGSSGTSGINGSSGTSGIDGTFGTSGSNGASGTSGSSGISGTFGTSGTSGISGTSGVSGTSGTTGTSGSSGLNGTSGIDGTSGTTGTSGTSGTGFNTVTNPLDNRVLTSDGTTNGANAEANMTFNGTTLDVTGNIIADKLAVDTAATPTLSVGEMRWNDTDGTVDLRLKGGNVTLQVGQEQVKRVVNKVGSDLLEANYQVVRSRLVSEGGAAGQRLAVVLAQANLSINSANTIGVVTETIVNNQEGFINTSGEIHNINTSGSLQGETWVDGDILYLSPTVPGQLTKVKPVAPQYLVRVAQVVYSHAINGKIDVNIQTGYDLGELNNVLITSVANNEGLFYDSATGLWKNETIASALTYTPANDANVVHLAGTETITGTKTFSASPLFDLGTRYKTPTVGYQSINALDNGWALGVGSVSQSLIFNTTINYNYTYPNASGTLVLTSDLSAYQTLLTNPVTGTGAGTTNYLPKFTGVNALGNSAISDNGSLLTLNYNASGAIDTRLNIINSGNGGSGRGTSITIGVPGSSNSVDGVKLNAFTTGGATVSQSTDFTVDTSLSGILSEKLRITSTGLSTFTGAVTTGNTLNVRNSSYDSTMAAGTVSLGFGFANHIGAKIEAYKQATNITGFKFYTENGFNTPLLGFTLANGGTGTFANSVIGNTEVQAGSDTQTGAGLVVNGAASSLRVISMRTAGVRRWGWRTDDTAEAGSNAGSDLRLTSYVDAGTQLADVLFVKRSTGNILIGTTTDNGNKLRVNGNTEIIGDVLQTKSDSRFNGGSNTGRLLVLNADTTSYIGLYGSSHATLPYVFSLVTNSVERINVNASGIVKVSSLASGTTTQMVTADLNGVLGYQAIPTVGTWGALNYPTWVSGTPFVKMTAAGTFALDTNVYALDSNVVHLTGNETITGNKSFTNTGTNGVVNGITLINNGTVTAYSLFINNTSSGLGALISNNSTTNAGLQINNGNTGDGVLSYNAVGGIGYHLINQTSGIGFLINGNVGSSGNLFVGQNSGSNTFTLNKEGNVTATSFIKSGGTSAQYLMADGTVSTLTITPSSFGSQTANTVLAAPDGSNGVPTFRNLLLTDMPDAWIKRSVGCATTAALTLNTAQTTIDGVTLTASMRVLIKDQSTQAQNGIYTNVTTTTWTRTADADTSSKIAGALVNVDAGTVNGGLAFDTDFKTTDTISVTSMTWNRVLNRGYLTTVGNSFATLTNPSAITFPRINADNTVSALDAVTFRTAIGAGTGSGTVTSVAALTLGTTGTDVSSTVATGTTTPVITLNIPTASAANRGALSAADWTTFNNKQAALTNPVTGSGAGTTNYVPKFNGVNAIINSTIYDNGVSVGLNTASPNAAAELEINGNLTFTAPGATTTAGEIVFFGTGTGLTAGNLYYLSTALVWTACNAGAASTSSGLLGIALGTAVTNGILLKGMARFGTAQYTGATAGQILYASTTAGTFSGTAPSATTQVVRVVGYCVTAGTTIYFNPDPTWITLV